MPTLAQSVYLHLNHARSCLRSIFQNPKPPTHTQVSGNRRHDCWWHRLCPHLFVSISITISLVHWSISFPSPTFSSSYRELDRSGPPCSAADWRHPYIAAPLTDMPSCTPPSSWHPSSRKKKQERERKEERERKRTLITIWLISDAAFHTLLYLSRWVK